MFVARGALARPENRGDFAQSLLSASNVQVTEGDAGSLNAVVQLSRGNDGYGVISYQWETYPIAGGATPGVDYTHSSGSGTIASGQTQNHNIPVLGDTEEEVDEDFGVRFFNIRFA